MAEDEKDEGWNALLGIGLLCYAGYKLLTSSKNDTNKCKNSISSSDIEHIVDGLFVFDDSSKFAHLLISFKLPDFLKIAKKEMIEDVLFSRLNYINQHIRSLCESNQIELPVHGDSETKDFFYLLLEKIFSTEKITSIIRLPTKIGNFNMYSKARYAILGGAVGAVSNSMMYRALKVTTIEYQNDLYLSSSKR